MTDSETIEKQNYLRIHILEAGYDSNTFVNYMDSLKGKCIKNELENGSDVYSWTLEELKEVVAKFIGIQKGKQEELGNQDEIKFEEVKPTISEIKSSTEQQKVEEQKAESVVMIYNEPLPDEIKTLPLETGEITDENHQCEIIETKVVNPGMFKSNYSSYLIKTTPEGWVAERKFESFVTLRNIICKAYPGYFVPPITTKAEKKLEREDVEKKKHYLELFLNDLISDPILRTAKIFHLFLSIASESEYEKQIKTYIKEKAPKYVQDYRTLEGIARVNYDDFLTKYCSALETGNIKLKKLYSEYF